MHLCIIIGILTFSFSPSIWARPLRIALAENYPPWSSGAGSSVQGLAVDLIREIVENQMHQKVEFIGMPWARAQKETYEGRYDALCAAVNRERLSRLQATNIPLFVTEIRAFAKNDRETRERMQGIKDVEALLRSDLVFNVNIGGGWKDKVKPGRVQLSSTPLSALRQLAHARGDVLVSNNLVMPYLIRQLGLQNDIYELPLLIGYEDFHLLLNPNADFIPDLERFDKILQKFKATPRYREMIERYKIAIPDGFF